MAKQRRPTFSDMVRAERDRAPVRRTPRLAPGRHGDVLVTRGGDRWALVVDSLDPVAAQRLVGAGARVAIDPCGCGGACGIDVLDTEAAVTLAGAGTPEPSTDPRHPGWLSHWIAEGDASNALVLVSGRVVWGRLSGR